MARNHRMDGGGDPPMGGPITPEERRWTLVAGAFVVALTGAWFAFGPVARAIKDLVGL